MNRSPAFSPTTQETRPCGLPPEASFIAARLRRGGLLQRFSLLGRAARLLAAVLALALPLLAVLVLSDAAPAQAQTDPPPPNKPVLTLSPWWPSPYRARLVPIQGPVIVEITIVGPYEVSWPPLGGLAIDYQFVAEESEAFKHIEFLPGKFSKYNDEGEIVNFVRVLGPRAALRTLQMRGKNHLARDCVGTGPCEGAGEWSDYPQFAMREPPPFPPVGQQSGQQSEAAGFTARYEGLPESHDGSSAFSFELHFSEAPEGLSYTTVAGGLLDVSGATVDKVRRLTPGSNLGWEVTVSPTQGGDIAIRLPTRACGETNAVCVGGQPLAQGVAAMVPGIPFTASFSRVPAEHDGAAAFDIRFHLNAEPASLSYRTVQDGLFDVTGGSIEKAGRLVAGKNKGWTLRIDPSGLGDVTVRVNATTACDTAPGVCTADGRKLPGDLQAVIAGPAAFSVADAEVDEGADAVLTFTVTLSKARFTATTVDYATSDDTATAGSDYTATSGMLTFGPLETTKTVSVPVLDDAHDEGSETLTLTLSNPNPDTVRLAGATATGTIQNSDPLPKVWTARFGRTVARHVVDALESRLDTASQSYARFDGHQLSGFADVSEAVSKLAPDRNLWQETAQPGALGQDTTLRQLLLGSAFHLVSNDDEDAMRPSLTAWGRVATSGFEGKENRLSLNGTVTTATLGVDGTWRRWLTGIALAYSEGDGSFTQVEAGGDIASKLTSLHPYVGYALSDRVRLWSMVGHGSGSLQLEGPQVLRTDLEMTMGALGVRGTLLEPSQPAGGLALSLRSDVLWMRMDTVATADLVATETDASRLRLILEGSRLFNLPAGGSLTPSVEVAVRHDGGDAETGTGLEVGGRLRFASAWGLSLEASARGLLAHEAADYQEWGASLALLFDPGQQGRGLSASITPTWGSAASGLSRLWGQPDAAGLAVDNALVAVPAGRLEAELGYGLGVLQGQGLLTPYARVALVEGAEQAWHLGTRLALAESLSFSVEARRRERRDDGAAHELALLATLGW